MAVTATPIFAQAPYLKSCSLAVNSACTTRAPTADGSMTATPVFGVLLTAASTNGLRIDQITVQACANAIGGATVAGTVLVWQSDGTTAYVIDEIQITAQTPSATAAAFSTTRVYPNGIMLPAASKMYVSNTVATTAAASALCVTAQGGVY